MEKNNGLEKMIDSHESEIRDLNKIVNKILIDLNILISEHKNLKELTEKILGRVEENKKKEDALFQRLEYIENEKKHKSSLWKAIKDNATTVAAIGTPAIGIGGTILYEIGKYLRNLPVN
jgi:hypothetical protein